MGHVRPSEKGREKGENRDRRLHSKQTFALKKREKKETMDHVAAHPSVVAKGGLLNK